MLIDPSPQRTLPSLKKSARSLCVHRNLSTILLALCTLLHVHASQDGEIFLNSISAGPPSPLRDIITESYGDENSTQIWLVSASDPGKRRLLFIHHRAADVIFSEDEKWLVINDRSGSSLANLLLYRRKAELEYEKVDDLTSAAWAFFEKRQGKFHFDHSYVEALRWAETSPPVLFLCLSGHMDSRNYTSEWYCLYNISTRKFSLNFARHNRRVTAIESE